MHHFSQKRRYVIFGCLLLLALGWMVLFSHLPRAAGQTPVVAIVSAASYSTTVAPDSIAAIYGVDMATRTEAASTNPLPTELAGTTVMIGGQPTPLFFVSPGQVNCLIPASLTAGRYPIIVRSGDGKMAQGEALINPVAPGIFTRDASGRGRPAAQLLRIRNGGFIFEDFGAGPIDLGPETEPAFLILYVTGLRKMTDNVRVLIAGADVPADGIGVVPGFSGLDQVNLRLPRTLSGRGLVNLSVLAPGAPLSNEVQVDIIGATGNAAPAVANFDVAEATAGEVLVINGNNFNADRARNIVRIGSLEATVLEANSNRLRVRVPYGVETGPVSVINARNDNERTEGRSASTLLIKTSLSGFIEDTRRQPLKDVVVRLNGGGNSYETRTSPEGLFSFRDLPNLGRLVEVEIDPTGLQQAGTLPFPKIKFKKSFAIGRDNYVERIPLQQESGPSVQVGVPPGFAPEQGGFARQISTGGVVFEVQPDTPARFPDGATSGRLTMTIVAESRTSIALPPNEYSSSVVQLTPFNVSLQRGGKLSFPNPERFLPGTQAKLYRLVTNPDQPTGFAEVGKAQVSADGQRIESAEGAIDTSSYYFVSLPRRSTNIVGRVVESDRQTPVRGALVTSRGQTTLTDGTGGFVLKGVLVNEGDEVSVDAGFLRPNGRVDRGQVSNIRVVVDGVTILAAPIVLTAQESIRGPIVLAPDSLILSEGERKEVLLLTAHPDGGQIVKFEVSGANFAGLESLGGGLYSLRLTPGNDARGTYTLRLIATDDRGQAPSYDIALTVNGRPRANPQTIVVTQNQPANFTLTGEDPEGLALSYVIVVNPANGRLTRTNAAGPQFTYTPNTDFVGNDELIFKVNDGLADSLEARATILVGRVNRSPVLTVPSPQTVAVGSPLNFTVTATDPDTQQTLTITATNRPGGSSFQQTNNTAANATAQFSWMPNASQVGNHLITFEVADSGTPTLRDTKTVSVTVTAANRPPIANAQNLTTNEDTPLNLTLSGSDPDGDALSYVIVSNPSNGTLSGNGATRTYTPRQNFNGTDSFAFKTNDGRLDSDTATVTITVNPVNDAPLLTVPGPQSVTVGQALSFNVSAIDVDTGQTLTLSATNLPTGATFTQTTATTGQFNWPSVPQAGNYEVTFRVADSGAPVLSDSKNVNIAVNAAPNPSPAITSLSPNSITAGSGALLLTVNGSGFVASSVVRWNSGDRVTTLVSSGQLSAQISANDLANAGTAQVTVFNPAPGGGTSNTVSFTVNASCSYSLQPTAKSISAAGGNDSFTVSTAAGCVWTAGSNASWITINSGSNGNGNGMVAFTVAANTSSNERVGSISAAGQTFTVTQAGAVGNSVPTVSSLSPNSATAGSAAFQLTVSGASFVNGSIVRWNGSNRTTTFVSVTQLRADILPSDVATAGTASVSVFTPAPGGGTSNNLNFTISSGCTYSVQLTRLTFTATGGNGTVKVTAGNGCAWRAIASGQWLTVYFSGAGTGNGEANYGVDQNFGPQRTGTITVAGQTFTITQAGASTPSFVPVSAASYQGGSLATESVLAGFGSGFSSSVAVAQSLPLPTMLAGTAVRVSDSSGTERLAPLFFVSPGQINLQIPVGTVSGIALLSVLNSSGTILANASLTIATTAPGLFTANATGSGVVFGQVLRIKSDGTQVREALSRFDSATNRWVAVTIDLSNASDQVYLLLRGTGIRNRSSLSAVTARLASTDATVSFAGAATEAPYATNLGVGEDQVNVLVPRSLAGAGEVNVVITVEGRAANTVTVRF